MYFLTQAFPRWDGYSIYNDPEVSVMVSKGTTPTSSPSPSQPPNQPTPPPTQGTSQPQPSSKSNKSSKHQNQHLIHQTTHPQPQSTHRHLELQLQEQHPLQPDSLPSMTILVIVGVGAIAAVGSLMLVRSKKSRKKA